MRRTLVAALLALATIVSTLVAATPAQAATYYTIANRNSGKCLAIGSGDQADGAHAIQWTCHRGYAEQQWILDSAGRWRNRYTDKCLAIGGGSDALGAHVVQWTCSTNDDQQWVHYDNNQYYNRDSGYFMAVGDASEADGAHVVQWRLGSGFEQQWLLSTV